MLNYAHNYFGKDLKKLGAIDIENYFKQARQESDKIEYKSYYAEGKQNYKEKENGILKTVCALLNSEGGLIVWGAPIGKKQEGKKEPEFKGELSPVNKVIEQDQFINRISDVINPTPADIRFQSIPTEDKYIYVLEVQKSPYSPHQIKGTYYMRLDGQTRTAPHHYVEALFKKVSYPNIKCYVRLKKFYYNNIDNRWELSINVFIFNWSELQNEHDISFRMLCDCGVFRNSDGRLGKEVFSQQGHQWIHENCKEILHYGEPYQQNTAVYFSNQDLKVCSGKISIRLIVTGRYSPAIMSVYEVEVYPTSDNSNQGNFCILDQQMNQYVFEKEKESGLSNAEILKTYGIE